MIKNISIELIRKNRFSIILTILLLFISIIITYIKILTQIDIGPPWDTFDFLADAMYFAGMDFGYTDLYRPPLIPLLTSIIFRLGFISEVVIFSIDGFFFILGVLGLFLLLKQRFNNFKSFLGTIIYLSFPVILLWIGTGYTDIASTTFSIWALYFTILSVRKSPNYFFLSFPMLALAFLTRFPSVIVIFPIFIYLLINRKSLTNYKYFVEGIIVALLIMIPAFLFYFNIFGNPFLPFSDAYGSSLGGFSADVFALNLDPFYYLTNSIYGLINLNLSISNSSIDIIALSMIFILILCSIIGLLIYLFNIFKFKKELNEVKSFISRKKIILFGVILLLVTFLITLNNINFLISDLLFGLLIYLIYKVLESKKINNLDLDLLFLSWLASFLIFSSVFDVKVYRYYIPMAPVVAYFVILGWSEFSCKIRFKLNKIRLTTVLSVLFVIALLISSFSFLYQLDNDPLAHGNNFKIYPEKQNLKFVVNGKPNTGYLYFETNNKEELKEVTNWLMNYDPEYKNKRIYSDYFWPQFSWYLKTFVRGIIDQKYKDTNCELTKFGADYYINIQYQVNLTNFTLIKEFHTSFGVIKVYKKI